MKVQKLQLIQLTDNLREGKPEAEEDAKLEEEVSENQEWGTNNQRRPSRGSKFHSTTRSIEPSHR